MKEPVRLREAGSPGAELLSGARRSRSMTQKERARSASRVDRLAVLPVAAGVWLWLKGVAVAAGLSVSAVVVVKAVHALSPAPSAPPVEVATAVAARTPAPAPKASAAPVAIVEPAPTAEPSAAPRIAAREAGSAPSSAAAPVDPLAAEAALLEEARSLSGASPAEALARLEAHAAKFPRGQLSLERELLTIDVLRRLGRTPEARARAEALLARSKNAIYEDRVRRMLETMP